MKTILFAIVAAALLPGSVFAGELVNVAGASKIAVNGFDTVAFFTDAKAVNGSPFITSEYKGAVYQFASEEHKALFAKSPEKYVPQFGGFCAYGVSLGKLFPIDITTWQIIGGKLYLNLNPDIRVKFDKDVPGALANANKNWPGLVKKHGK